MRLVLITLSLALCIALPIDAKDTKDAKDAKSRKESKTRKETKPPRGNLKIPTTLSEKGQKSLESGIGAYKEALSNKKKRDWLLRSAIKKLQKASKDEELSEVALTHFRLGAAYNFMKKLDKAQVSLEKASELNAKFYQSHVLLAEVLTLQGEPRKGLIFYDRALKLYPSYMRALQGKAETLVRIGDYKEASKFAKKALSRVKSKKGDEDDNLRKYLMSLVFTIQAELRGNDWKKEYVFESENYIIKTSISEEFAKEISRRAELIRRAYMKIFPNIKRPARKYEIVVHKNRTAYRKAGGSFGAAGHYSPLVRKLVLYKNKKMADTLIVLHHEAFHQFLHEYLALAPQWFNEGLGDYFAPFEYVKKGRKEVMRSHSNPWRIRHIRYAIRTKQTPEPGELMLMTHEEMYDYQTIGVNYAMAWSLIYYMIENRTYTKVLHRYFQALRKGDGLQDAYDASFGKIDMEKFTERWKAFILKTE